MTNYIQTAQTSIAARRLAARKRISAADLQAHASLDGTKVRRTFGEWRIHFPGTEPDSDYFTPDTADAYDTITFERNMRVSR